MDCSLGKRFNRRNINALGSSKVTVLKGVHKHRIKSTLPFFRFSRKENVPYHKTMQQPIVLT